MLPSRQNSLASDERERERDRQTDRQTETERERKRETDRQTDRQGGGATDRPSIKTSLDSNENRTVSIRLKNQ